MGKKVRKKFVCRHCGKLVYVEGISHTHPGEHLNVRVMSQGGTIKSYVCNECGKLFDHVFIQPKKAALMGKNVERVTPKSKKVST